MRKIGSLNEKCFSLLLHCLLSDSTTDKPKSTRVYCLFLNFDLLSGIDKTFLTFFPTITAFVGGVKQFTNPNILSRSCNLEFTYGSNLRVITRSV